MDNARFFSVIHTIALPDLGEGTKEATIKEWYVEPGSVVEEFDDLVEVFTDKLVAKIPSTCTGVVKEIKFDVDDICLVGHTLLSIEVVEEADESTPVAEAPPVAQAAQPQAAQAQAAH